MKQRDMGRFVLVVGCAIGLLAVGAGPSNAALVLSLDDISTTGLDVIVVDNSVGGGAITSAGVSNAGDPNPIVGMVGYYGLVGNFWVSATTGTSKPVIGDNGKLARMDLLSVDVSSGEGELVLRLTDTDFFLASASTGNLAAILGSAIGGTTDGSVTFVTELDLGNEEFGIGSSGPVIEMSQGPFEPGTFGNRSFSDDQAVTFDLPSGSVFSLTQTVTVVHDGPAQMTSFDADSVVHTPEPSTFVIWSLLGTVAGSLGWWRRRRSA